jgi:hypothetical protein
MQSENTYSCSDFSQAETIFTVNYEFDEMD